MISLTIKAAVFCAVLLAFLTLIQRSLIYFPAKFASYDMDYLSRNGLEIRRAGNLEWLLSPALHDGNRSKNAVIVLFHGNGGAALHRDFKAKLFNLHGYDVVLAEYPGYATNPGRPSEKAFYGAARVIIEKTLEELPEHALILYGESIGSGVALQMATEYDTEAVIVEAGFSSLADAAARIYPFLPVRYLLWDRYDNLEKISGINTRLIVIHGENDTIVPIALGRRLFDAAGNDKVFMQVDRAGHNDIYDYLSFSELIGHLP